MLEGYLFDCYARCHTIYHVSLSSRELAKIVKIQSADLHDVVAGIIIDSLQVVENINNV